MSGNSERSFLERLPSNLPFAPFVRRPDYQLRHIKMKVKLPLSINHRYILTFMLIGLFFIYIGGFYYLSNDQNYSLVNDPKTGEPSPIWKGDINNQTLFEGITAGILMFTGSSGFYLIHLSTQHAYAPNTAAKFLLSGIALILFALASLVAMLIKKEILPDIEIFTT